MPCRYNKRIKSSLRTMYPCPPTLALSCVVRADTLSWEASSSRRSLRIWKKKNAEEKRVEKRKKKAQMKRRGKGGTHKGSRCVVERQLCDLVSKGEIVCRCMDRMEVCCTGGCKDHRDVRWNKSRPQIVFTAGQWWWINPLQVTAVRFTGM